MKSKEIVKLMQKKSPRTGVISLYLEQYKDGKRSFEFLRMYLNPGKDPATKATNKATLEAAKTIQAQRIIEIQRGEANILKHDKPVLFSECFENYLKDRPRMSESLRKGMTYTVRRWTDFAGENVKANEITPKMLLGFAEYLRGDLKRYYIRKDGERASTPVKLKERSVRKHYDRIVIILNAAHRDGLITKNPASQVDPSAKPKDEWSERAFLTGEEMAALIASPCPNPELKRAFLFACYTGLRKSDVLALTWGNIYNNGISIRMQKTKDHITIPLSKSAMKYLGERGDDSDHPFSSNSARQIGRDLLSWAKNAGLKKHLTFHVSRHTFATLALTYGADIYTVSKLLGHKNLKTTQVYAQIVDKKKEEAVNLIPDLTSGTPEPAD